ncbi:hypothetical protein [Saccharicrinis sp. GN24d3]|uniref:hypothetical protein n=1 Tax=Saccharicrinis sp. GN24d3 TaxID=3458416 RepID=UPI0040351A43
MKYFLGITDIEQAKLRYRKLAKQLHPDGGGTAIDFQKMQTEYKEFLLSLQKKCNTISNVHQTSPENELLSELGKLAKVLIKKEVPQDYLLKKIEETESSLMKNLYGDVVNLLNNFK